MQNEYAIRVESNKILYIKEEQQVLWPGQTVVLRTETPIRQANIGNQFGVVLDKKLLDSSIFLIQSLFCCTYDEYLILRLHNLNFNDNPLTLKMGCLIGHIFVFS